jgi:hypothetical protein
VKRGRGDLSKREKMKGWFWGRKVTMRDRKIAKKMNSGTSTCMRPLSAVLQKVQPRRRHWPSTPPTSFRDPAGPHCADPAAPANLHSHRERGSKEARLGRKGWIVCVCFFYGEGWIVLVGLVWFRSSGKEKLLTVSTRSVVENDL